MPGLYYMDIPATNVTAQYPSDGVGGITTDAGAKIASGPNGVAWANIRVLGVEPTASAASTNLITITPTGGTAVTTTLPTSATANGFYALPEQGGKTPADVAAYAADYQIGAGDGGVPVGSSFTAKQGNAVTWAVRIWFTADYTQA
jgi:hypothetical protein